MYLWPTVRRCCLVLLCLTVGAAGASVGQLAPPGTGGVAALANALHSLGAEKRVLVIGAHPDDEDNPLLAWLGHGAGARAAYLSLTRGEGGQNIIGAELGVELGVIRSEELLAARRIDGTEQLFGRAYDFGFSKSADESFHWWPRDSLVKDVIDVMRRFRPQVVIVIFSGTPRDGHGQHQVSALVARQAFDALRDSTWGPVKLYRSTGYFDTAETTLRIPSGVLDPVEGRSYFQIGMAARSEHRSQGEGQLQRAGPATIRLAYLAGRVAAGSSLFAGVDTLPPSRARYAALIDTARGALTPQRPAAVVPYLARALDALDPADEQRTRLQDALARAAGLVFDATVDDDIVTPGERLQVEATVWNGGDAGAHLDSVTIDAPPGWTAEPFDLGGASLGADSVATRRFVVSIAPTEPRTQPYFLRRPMVGDLYDWAGTPVGLRGMPFEPPPLSARAWVSVASRSIVLSREVVDRVRDKSAGEVRRPLLVTQDFDVRLAPDLAVWPADAAGDRHTLEVTVTNRRRGPAHAQLVLSVPRGWPAVAAIPLSFDREDEARTVTVAVQPPASVPVGNYSISGYVIGPDGRKSDGWLEVIDYPHIRVRGVAHPSSTEIRVAKLALPALAHVGYVRGAADRVPEALAGVGLPAELIDADSLEGGDLSHFNAIVIGSRAYEIDPTLAKSNERLLEYVKNGGTLLVQYQQYPFVDGHYAPFPLSMARPHDRVTDEGAPVTILDATSPAFHSPNEIGVDDWAGWVQDRGLYFAHTWDQAYEPLIETHDPGEGPERGGLLVAQLGRGVYVYTGLAFFRELPAGVVGAYRLFVNLLALRGASAQ